MIRAALVLIASLLIVSSIGAATGQFDTLTLTNGSVLEGCITITDNGLGIETLAGVLHIPFANVETYEVSDKGASELLLGARLLDRGQYERSRNLLRTARRYRAYRTTAAGLMDQLEEKVQQEREARMEEERQRIERLIQRKGLKAGIAEIRKLHEEEQAYWGGYRGRLHLEMARERLNHLDLSRAERHLVLAEQYGVDPEEWDRVRNELLEMRRTRIRMGDEVLARMQPKPRPKPAATNFLKVMQEASQRGEKLPPMEYLEYLDQHARYNSLDPLLVWAMIDVESSWRPRVVSHKGAQGLMQLMPFTASDMDVDDPFDPEQNIRGGTRYMRFLLSMFDDVDTALAAYNMGPGRIERSDGIPNAGQRYIRKVRERLSALQQRFRL